MFDWLQYLNLAERLVLTDSEACYRSAVSRAYYGVFCKIRKELEKSGINFNSLNTHQRVIEWIKNQSDPEIALIGKELERLRYERNYADYEDKYVFNKYRAEKSLLQARSIIHSAQQARLI